jgi:phytoene dehydrogenase-like protein
MDQVTVVGGGLAGLIAATEVAEAGVPVRLVEARERLGGRARTTGGGYHANLGPHALYTGTTVWGWLEARGLARPCRRPSLRAPLRVRWDGELRRTPPPAATLALLRALRRPAPVDRDLRSWLTDVAGADAARLAGGLAGPLTFDHDPGRLSAAFVADRIRRILLRPLPAARYVIGGWGTLVDRVADHARAAGVDVETGARVTALDDLADRGPLILALDPPGARALLGDDGLRPESPRVALLDVGLERRRGRRAGGDPYLVADLDESAFVDRFTAVDPGLAPEGHELVQASVGVRPGEGREAALARLETVLDLAFDGWRDRVAWQRRGLVTEATGALDLPGTTWRDRTPLGHADGVWLAGDWLASPGHLSEASHTSAVEAARAAVAAFARARSDGAAADALTSW